jgi:hypothetical protein
MRVLLKALAVLAVVGALASEAAACTYQCVKVAPLCRRCVDVGTTTNATCQDSGPCACFYTQNTCGLLTDNKNAAEPTDVAAAEVPTSCNAAADALLPTVE